MNTTDSDVKLESVIRVRKLELRVSTVWTLEKFQQKLIAMNLLCEKAESCGLETADDVFCDPDDAWVADSPSSSQSSQLHTSHL